MCGRYTLFTEEETDELRRIVEELQKKKTVKSRPVRSFQPT